MFRGSSLVWLASGAIAVRRFRGWVGYDIAVMVCGLRWPWKGSRKHDRVGMKDASILGMHPAFMSDALADTTHANSHLDDCDCSHPNIVTHNGANPCPAYCTNCFGNQPDAMAQAQREAALGAAIFAMGSDELRALDPALWLLRGQFVAQMNAAFAKGASLTGAYQAAPEAAKAMDSDLYATGVI